MIAKTTIKPGRLRLFALGAILGILAFLLVYGTASLDVTNDAFCRGGYLEKDIQQHYAGWLFYRQSALSFPLCVTTAVNAPQGVSIAYTDSIPLIALVCRPLANFLGGTFQYFGWFTLLCFALQGGFGALLCGLFADGWLRPLIGDLLFITSPILYERAFRHTSLGAQWFVLAALYLYFYLRREGRYTSPALFVLNVIAIGIHPYFLPMTYAITLALLLEHAVTARQWKGPAMYLAANLLCTLALGWMLGLFYGTATNGGQALYGYFSMNLNSLWNPSGVGGTLYSRILPAQNQVNGNYDAFAYLGLGVLIALPIVAVLARRRIKQHIIRHWALLAVCGVLTAFAVSNTITANGAVLATIPLPGKIIELCSVFRSGGRLFWPVYDLLILSAFAGVTKLPCSLSATVLLAVVQIWDVSPGLYQRHKDMTAAMQNAAFPSGLESIFWQEAAGQYTHLASVEGLQDDALHLALYAADHGMTTNDPFAARYDAQALETERTNILQQLANGILESQTLYLFESEGAFLQAVEPVKEQAWCGQITSKDGTCTWYVIAPGMQGDTFDDLCTVYDESYPLRLADYTDALWNRGVLDSTKQTVCFADSEFVREKLKNAKYLCANGKAYTVLSVDDSDPGWLMVTLEIEDATVLWDQELTTK
ncbi:DUF6311 domain-containing protein [uncultured Subdoligranulum sp.]|uniref:DUF6311 domain-containing protein n=1 Tax=uncultured Subdoligranulum sp. TaxID=512298 RepID=UPI0026200625|nr:DUF6311 domain-containing protein [uncultured Subdoligranulum sp.]